MEAVAAQFRFLAVLQAKKGGGDPPVIFFFGEGGGKQEAVHFLLVKFPLSSGMIFFGERRGRAQQI